jgi:hypothetical protein
VCELFWLEAIGSIYWNVAECSYLCYTLETRQKESFPCCKLHGRGIKLTAFQLCTHLVISPRKKGLSIEEILKLQNELSKKKWLCDKNTFDDERNFFINEGKTIGENVHIISSSESSSSDSELNENIPSKWSSDIHNITKNCKNC